MKLWIVAKQGYDYPYPHILAICETERKAIEIVTAAQPEIAGQPWNTIAYAEADTDCLLFPDYEKTTLADLAAEALSATAP